MQITTNREIFLKALVQASRFTSSRVGATAGLQGILFQNDKGTLHIYSTNLNTFFHTAVPSKQQEERKFLLDPHKIIEFISLLNDGEMTLFLEKDRVLISQKKTKGTFPFLSHSDFPTPPPVVGEGQTIEVKKFEELISLVLFSASRDLSRPVLSGINFVEKEGDMDVVATDGFRLSLFHMRNELNMKSMLIPADFLLEMMRNIKEKKTIIMNYLDNEKMVYFKTDNDEYFTRLIEGDFPPYERVIPVEKKTTITVDKNDLIRNVKLISVFARDYSSIIVCQFKKGELTLSPKIEGGVENSTTQEIELEGEEMRVAFNFKFLLEFLNTINEEQVIIELLRPDAPVVLKTKKTKDYLHIIMPVRIQE
ncbi:MAG: DNA polymerase III subunit beta [bacterium]